MKKINLLFAFICVMIFQVNGYAQDDDIFFSFFGIDPKAEEIVALRTETSKTFDNGDTTYTALIFTSPIHELDGNEEWQDIYLLNELINIPPSVAFLRRDVDDPPYWGSNTGFRLGYEETVGGAFRRLNRTFLRWQTTPALPVNANVQSTELVFSGGSYDNEAVDLKYELNKLDTDPGTTKIPWNDPERIEELFEDCGDDLYIEYDHPDWGDPINFFNSTPYVNSAFRNDLMSRLPEGWMAIGLKNSDEGDPDHFVSNVTSIPLKVVYIPGNDLTLQYPPNMYFNKGQSEQQSLTINHSGGPINFTIEINDDDDDWINIYGYPFPNPHTTPRNFTVDVYTDNTGSSTRTGQIYLYSSTPGITNPVCTIYVHQKPKTASLVVSPTTITADPKSTPNYTTVGVSNTNNSVTVNYNIIYPPNIWYHASTNSGSTTWGTPTNFNIIYDPNYTGYFRQGIVTVQTTSPTFVSPLFQDVYINQAAIEELTLPDEEVPNLESYIVTDWIEANTFEVSTNGNIEDLVLGAGNKITLKPGFIATSSNGTFRAYIHDFGGITPDNLISNTTGESKKSKVLSLKKEKDESNQIDNLEPEEIPTEYDLFQNYPNPFNPTTNIKFALPERSYVNLAVYNLIGQKVAELTNNELEAGYHSIQFNGSMLSSGLYFYRITTNKFSKTYKMLLVK